MFEERHSLEVLREWIEEGISSEKRQSEAYLEARENRLLFMPPFKEHLSAQEIDDLMAFVALQQYSNEALVSGSQMRGEDLARRFACFTCHGELGQGGVMNPGSLKGYIPGFFGKDFRALTQNGDIEDVVEWIENGASDAFLDQGFPGFYPGRFFTERQVIKMPAYKGLLTSEETRILAEFVLEVLAEGPLAATGIHKFRPMTPKSQPSDPGDQSQPFAADPLFREAASILVQGCLKCHGPEKQRSGYRMDTRETAFSGGEIADFMETSAVIPGNSDSGLLIQFVEALEEDIDNEVYPMPPGDNPRLSKVEIDVLRSWIDKGADWPEGYRLKPETE